MSLTVRSGRLVIPERHVQKACVDLLRAEGWLVFETHTDARKSMGSAGQPDLVAIDRTWVPNTARLLLIEVKRSRGGRVRKSQRAWHAEAVERGFRVLIVKDVDELREVLKQAGC